MKRIVSLAVILVASNGLMAMDESGVEYVTKKMLRQGCLFTLKNAASMNKKGLVTQEMIAKYKALVSFEEPTTISEIVFK